MSVPRCRPAMVRAQKPQHALFTHLPRLKQVIRPALCRPGLVGSERDRRHPHHRARSAPQCGFSRGPRAYRVRVWPSLVFRIRGNVVLSENGVILPGDKTHRRRRRLTRSWWNDVWRDRLLAAVHFLADSRPTVQMEAGSVRFTMATWPLTAKLPVSYEAVDAPLPTEEDDEGNIVPTAALDDHLDDLESEEEPEEDGESDT
jgi:hypothetical protein